MLQSIADFPILLAVLSVLALPPGASAAAQPVPSGALEAIAQDASLVVRFDLKEETKALQALRQGVFAAVGFEKDWERFSFLTQAEASEISQVLVVGFGQAPGEDSSKAALIWGEFSEKTLHALALSQQLTQDREFQVRSFEGLTAFGDAEAIDRFAEAVRASEGGSAKKSGRLDFAQEFSSAPAWGVLAPAWFGPRPDLLDCEGSDALWSLKCAAHSSRWTGFAAAGSSSFDLKVKTIARDEPAAALLADELKNALEPPWFRPPNPLESAASEAAIELDGNSLSVHFEASSESLEGFAGSSFPRLFLTWRLNAGRREEWQKIPQIFEALQIGAGSRVADLGAGAGFITVRLARRVGEQGRVWAVDITPNALKSLRRRKEAGPYPQVEVVEGKEDNPRLPRGALDAVLIVNAYHEMSAYKKILKHIYRSLKLGGRLVLVEPFNPDTRSTPRGDQVRVHDLAPELVEKEVRAAGFDLVDRQDDFITEQGRSSLVVAQKPDR